MIEMSDPAAGNLERAHPLTEVDTQLVFVYQPLSSEPVAIDPAIALIT
jgi:hypothetical protein